MTRRWRSLAVLAALLLITFIVYGRILTYSFMYDDPLEMGRGAGRSLVDILTSSPGYAYYRPLTFVLWQCIYAIFHRYDLVVCHSISLLVHGVNAFLVYVLLGKVTRRRAAFVAAVLFVLFPLSYQVVQWIAALSHELATMFILLTLLAYGRFRGSHAWIWLAASLVAAVLAFLSHETGVTVGLFVVLWEVWLSRQSKVAWSWRWPLVYLVLSAAFVLVWYAVPKDGGGQGLSLTSAPENALYYLQGFAYPITGIAVPVQKALGWFPSAYVVAGIGVALALLLLFVAYRAGRRLPVLLFSLSWLAVAAAPVVATRSFEYVMNGPRLLYLSSVGIALAWAGLTALEWSRPPSSKVWPLAALVFVGLVALGSYRFVALRNEAYRVGSAAVLELSELSRRYVGKGSLTVVNMPGWIAPPEASFALGNTGVTMVPSYVGLDAVTGVHTGMAVRTQSLTYPDLLVRGRYTIGPHGPEASLEALDASFRNAAGVVLVSGNEAFDVQHVGDLDESVTPAADGKTLARWDEQVALEDASLQAQGETAVLNMRWRCLAPAPADLTVFVHVYDAAGQLVSQADHYPIGNMSAVRLWRAGDVAEDSRRLHLPPGLSSEQLKIGIGLYDRASGRRVAVTGPTGERLPDDMFVLDAGN